MATVKIFMAYKGTPLFTADEDLFEALQIARETGVLVLVHAENGDVIAKLQEQALARGDTAPRFHATTRPEAVRGGGDEPRDPPRGDGRRAAARRARHAARPRSRRSSSPTRAARPSTRETCPQYLVFSDADLARDGFEGAKYVLSPPLRDPRNRPALWHGLQTADLHIFGSDHCSFNFAEQKELGLDDFTLIPNGAPGAEERAQVLWTHGVREGRITENRFVAVLADQPGRGARHGGPQGRARARRRRRHRRLGPGADDHRDAGQPARQRRLHAVRGDDLHRRTGGGLRARLARLPRRRGGRGSRLGPLRPPRVPRSPRPARRCADGGRRRARRGGPEGAPPPHGERGRRPARRLDGHVDHGARLARGRARRDRRRHRRARRGGQHVGDGAGRVRRAS